MALSRKVEKASYPIGTLARLTGVSTHALRIWERRYGALQPTRTPKGSRRYSERDVERARQLKALTTLGHSIGSIAHLPDAQLRRVAAGEQGAGLRDTAWIQNTAALTEVLVSAATALDPEQAARALRQVSSLLAPRDAIVFVIAPALAEIGKRWEDAELCIAGEHAISALLRSFLGQLLDAASTNTGPPILCTTPAGELHELGALLVAVLISLHGRRVLYLGPNLPAEEIVRAVRLADASAVALSVVALEPERLNQEVAILNRLLPRNVALVLGGRVAAHLGVTPARGLVLRDLAGLEAWLAGRRDQPVLPPR